MIVLDLSILNQKGTPMFNSDTLANRPSPAVVGRIFIAIDAPYGLFRDTGSVWEQIASAGGADTNIYNTSGTLTGNRIVSSGGFSLTFNPSTTFATTLTAPTGSGAFAALGLNTLSYTAAFSSSNLGNVYAAIGGINLQTFAGSATFANANLAAANISVNSVDFSSASSTITMTQATGLRVMAGHQNQFQYQGTNSGTITHAATSQNLGFYRPPGSPGVLTITNAYSHLINALDDYGAGFVFTNRWGIYQAGASDTNYFAGKLLIGTTTITTESLSVNGSAKVSGTNSSAILANGGITLSNTGGAANTPGLSFEVGQATNSQIIVGNSTFPFAGGSDSLNFYHNLAGPIVFFNGSGNPPSRRFSVLTNGRVVVGDATTASTTFVVNGAFNGDGITINGSQVNLGFSIANSSAGANTWGFNNAGTGSSQTAGTLAIGSTNNTMLLFATGNVVLDANNAADSGQKIQINGSIRVNGQLSGSAGSSSGQHLIINCDGVQYKIDLRNP